MKSKITFYPMKTITDDWLLAYYLEMKKRKWSEGKIEEVMELAKACMKDFSQMCNKNNIEACKGR